MEYITGQVSSSTPKVNPKVKPESYDISKMSNKMDIDNKPEDVTISTITMTCKMNTEFLVENIGKYINLEHDRVVSVKYGNNIIRSLIPKKVINQKKKKQKKNFYNQVTLKVRTKKDKDINIKLFINGSIQMTGCKSIESSYEALSKLFEELRIEKGIIDMKNGKIVDVPFISKPENLKLDKIEDFNIAMINSNFKIGFHIDREKLYDLMTSDGIDCTYDPLNHAGVIVRYMHTEKPLSIFIFESGSIVITGVRNCQQIKEAYEYINKYLLTRYRLIQKNDALTNNTIMEYLNTCNQEQNS